jgi:hypothetical protein
LLYFIPSVVKTDEIYFLKDPIIYKIDYENLNFLFLKLYFYYFTLKGRIDKKNRIKDFKDYKSEKKLLLLSIKFRKLYLLL